MFRKLTVRATWEPKDGKDGEQKGEKRKDDIKKKKDNTKADRIAAFTRATVTNRRVFTLRDAKLREKG